MFDLAGLEELARVTDPADKAALIAELAFQDLPEHITLVARRCVILHWFDLATVQALIPHDIHDEPAAVYDRLASLPFIESVPWGRAYHDLTRQGLLSRYVQAQPELLITAARLAAPTYVARQDASRQVAEAFYCHIIAGQSEEAVALLDKAMDALFAQDIDTTLACYFSVQDEAETIPFVKPLIRTARHWAGRSFVHCYANRWAAAIAELDKAIELDPNYVKAYMNRGVAYTHLKKYKAALDDYDRAIQLDPNNALAYTNRGIIHANFENYKAALADLDRATELHPNLAQAYSNRGIIHARFKNYKAALADLDRAVKLDPNLAQAYTNRGGTYAALKNYPSALTDLDHAIELDPNDAQAYHNRGLTYASLKNYKAALADLDRVIELDPNWALAYYNHGLIYLHMNRGFAALADLNRTIELDPNLAMAFYNRGVIYASEGLYFWALADYARAIQLILRQSLLKLRPHCDS